MPTTPEELMTGTGVSFETVQVSSINLTRAEHLADSFNVNGQDSSAGPWSVSDVLSAALHQGIEVLMRLHPEVSDGSPPA